MLFACNDGRGAPVFRVRESDSERCVIMRRVDGSCGGT
jgi:hypothetical protein